MRYVISSFLAVALSFAAASAFPSDADVFVIDRAGTIVGIGTTVAGEVFELELMAGFDGFAELTIVTPAGEVVVHDVVVMGGVVFLDLVDIALMAREAGFGTVHVSAVDLVAEEAEGGPRDVGMGSASDADQTSAGEQPDERAHLGRGNAPEAPDAPGRPDEAPETPRHTPERPAAPVEPPVVAPDPPVARPDPPVARPDPPVARPEPPVVPPEPPVVPPELPSTPPEPPSTPPEPPVVPPVVDPPAEPEPVVPPSERPVEPPVVSIDPPVDPVEGPARPDRDAEEAEEEED